MDALTERTCPECHGTGCIAEPDDCGECGGTGAVPRPLDPRRKEDVMIPAEATCRECGETTVQVPCDECKFGTCMACGYPCACPDIEEAYAISKAENDLAAGLPGREA